MRNSSKSNSLFRSKALQISLLLLIFFVAKVPAVAQVTMAPGGTERFAVEVTTPRMNISGLCVLKTDSLGDARGSVVNEFGVRAFDFTVTQNRRKVKIYNALPMLRKWPLKRLMRRALRKALNNQPSVITLTPLPHETPE